jgi:acyl carrier protein phosphodiesterase
MNHLAHVLLAGADEDMQLGGLLADFWRGAPDAAWRERIRAGVVLHRHIDVYTDSHPIVARLRDHFKSPFRRYAGILLDVYFDHALARCWSEYAYEPIDAVSARALRLVDENRDWLPADLVRFAGYMRSNGLFAGYVRREMIEHVLAGISRRLSRANPLGAGGAILWQNADLLDAGFAEFFPDLMRYAQAENGT